MNRFSGIALALGVAALALFSATRITFNVNLLDLLPQDLPEVKGLSKFMDHFSRRGELILTMEADTANTMEGAPQSLAGFLGKKDGLVKKIQWRPQWMENPVAFAELPAFLWFNGSHNNALELASRLEPTAVDAQLEATIEEMTNSLDSGEVAMSGYDPLNLLTGGLNLDDGHFGRGINEFGSEDGAFHVLYVAHGRAEMNYKESAEWIAQVQEAVAEWQAANNGRSAIRFDFTGEPAFQSEIGGGMHEDMSSSIVLTISLVLFLFWLMHRRLAPLVWMAKMLGLILALTVIVGGLMFGKLSVMSVGFAAILIGLAVDYGVVVYTECRQTGSKKSRHLWKTAGPSIAWASLTTAAVFLSLNFSSLPGIRQLGSLVAVGIIIGAIVMLGLYSRVTTRLWADDESDSHVLDGLGTPMAMPMTIILLIAATLTLSINGMPSMWTSFDALRPRISPATDALEHMATRLSGAEDGRLPLIVTADSTGEMPARLASVKRETDLLVEEGVIERALIFDPIWANAANQSANRELFTGLAKRKTDVLAALDRKGFSDQPAQMVAMVFDAWADLAASDGPDPVWPSGELSRELLSRVVVKGPEDNALLGTIVPAANVAPGEAARLLKTEGAYITGWETLGPAVRPLIVADIWQVFVPMAGLLVVMLGAVFRCWRTTLLALCALAFSGTVLLALMSLLGMRWNFLNVCAFPLLLGTGIDYSIHMLLALKRHNGNLPEIRRGIGRALLFCGGSSAIGFGSLGIANNVGLASLGQVCAIGILITMISAIYFLPAWWRWMFLPRVSKVSDKGQKPTNSTRSASGLARL